MMAKALSYLYQFNYLNYYQLSQENEPYFIDLIIRFNHLKFQIK